MLKFDMLLDSGQMHVSGYLYLTFYKDITSRLMDTYHN